MNIQKSFWAATLLCCAAMTSITSQAFDTGSDGSYGDLIITNVGTTNIDMPSDGIFRCTSIYIATNCTLKFNANSLNTPVYLLAQSNILIAGTIDVSGGNGQVSNTPPSIPGPGGFAGGAGGNSSGGVNSGSGQGPGGGNYNTSSTPPGGSFGTAGYGNQLNASYGNLLLVPLIGGSGGSGLNNLYNASGGAGAGAILLASDTSVLINNTGLIRAKGGNGVFAGGGRYSGGGSGGAVRIVSPSVSVAGVIDVSGGTNSNSSGTSYGGNGRVRIDTGSTLGSLQIVGNGKGSPAGPVVSYGRSMFVFPPASPQLYFANVAGTNIQAGVSNNIVLGSGSSTSQIVTLCGTNFVGSVPVQIVATPVNGTPFTTNIVMEFPAPDILVSTNVQVTIPAGISTQLNAYANYGVQP